MTAREKTVCFTGPRRLPEDPAALYERVCAAVDRLIGEGYRYFGVGGALGFDELAARAVLSRRGIHPAIRLIAVLPCGDWNARWDEGDRRRWDGILRQADKITVLQERYAPGCMQRRNRHLVDESTVCVCLDAPAGGTAYTVAYAQKQGRRIIAI
ncbi:MAG: SLOG family protein [Acutalibacteraceae bacterium]